MPELEAPSLSAPLEHFRQEVGRRATHQGRLRQLAIGATATLVLVAATLAWAGLATSPGDVHRSASRPVTTPSPTPSGEPDRNGAASSAQAPSAQTPSTTIPPFYSAGPQLGADVLTDPPSGSTHRVAPGTPVVVALVAPPTGRWGNVRIVTGLGSVLTPGGQSGDAKGDVHIVLKAIRAGAARIEVPCLGNPAGSWHGVIEVTG